MSDGKVTYEVRVDDSKVDQDLNQADAKVKQGSSKMASVAAAVGKAAAAGFGAAGTAAVKFGTEFETSMAKSSTLIDTNAVDMGKLEKSVLDLSDKTGVAASQLGNTMYNALSAGVQMGEDGADMMAFLEKNAKLAKAGFTDVDTAVTATAKVMNAYKMDVQDTDKVHKILMQTQNNGITTVGELGSVLANVTPTAAAMGVEFEQVGAGLASMTAQGTPAAQATTQLNSLFAELGKSGTQAQVALGKATEGTKYAGMSFQDMMKEGVPLNEVLDLMGDYAAENGLTMLDMFSSIEAGKGALAISGENAEGFTTNLKAMSTEADVVGEAFEKVSSTSAEKFAKMINQLKNAAIELFVSLEPIISVALPILASLLEGLMGVMGKILTFAQEHQTIMGLILIGVTTLAVAIAAYTIAQNAAAIATAISTAATAAFGAAIAFITSPITIVILAIGALVAAAWLIFKNFDEIKEFLSKVWEGIKTKFSEFAESLKKFFETLWSDIKTGISNAWNTITTTISTLVTKIKDLVVSNFRQMVDDTVNKLNTFKTTISTIIDSIKTIFNGIITFLTGVFTGNWSKAWSGIVQIFSGIFGGIKSVVSSVLGGVVDKINGLIGGINKITGKVGVPNIPSIPMPRFHKGGIVGSGGSNGLAPDEVATVLQEGEMVLTAQHQQKLLAALSNPGSVGAAAPPVVVHNVMTGNIEVDGFTLGTVVMRNIDDVAAFMVRK